jgi:hypothetical protein
MDQIEIKLTWQELSLVLAAVTAMNNMIDSDKLEDICARLTKLHQDLSTK